MQNKKDSSRFGDRISTVVTHQAYTATIFSTAGAINTILLEKRIFDPVKSYQDRAGDIPPELVRKIYCAMQKISSTKLALAEEEALERD